MAFTIFIAMAKSRYLISPSDQEFKTSARSGPAYEDPKRLIGLLCYRRGDAIHVVTKTQGRKSRIRR
jgi:hypothetical protein